MESSKISICEANDVEWIHGIGLIILHHLQKNEESI